jgi:hypothetical protein
MANYMAIETQLLSNQALNHDSRAARAITQLARLRLHANTEQTKQARPEVYE